MALKLLDLFCKAGGASMGYARAGFEVTGVDIEPQKHYPFTFIQADALTVDLSGYDVIAASPPCQFASPATAIHGYKHENLIPAIRQRLKASGVVYVIENVSGARKHMEDPIMLCGTMFGLKLRRHRMFETNIPIHFLPASCGCKGKEGFTNAQHAFSSFAKGAKLISVAGHNFAVADARVAMGIDWMSQGELAQAIPPAYTEFIGKQILKHLAVCNA